jgi:hypothetical protein
MRMPSEYLKDIKKDIWTSLRKWGVLTPIPIHADGPSTSFQMSAIKPSPIAASTFAVKETSFPLSSENMNASDGELQLINRKSSSSKPRARHSLLYKLNLALFSELTPRNGKLYKHIWNKQVHSVNSKRNTRERSWKISAMWPVIH